MDEERRRYLGTRVEDLDALAVFPPDAGDLDLYVADGSRHASLGQVSVADDAGTLGLELGDNRCHLGFQCRGDQPSDMEAQQLGDRVSDQCRGTAIGERVLGEVGR